MQERQRINQDNTPRSSLDEEGKQGPSNIKQQNKVTSPPWMQVEKISVWERTEICIYRFISIFPVFVTFGLYTQLFSFFIGVSYNNCNDTIVLRLSNNLRKLRHFAWNSKPLVRFSLEGERRHFGIHLIWRLSFPCFYTTYVNNDDYKNISRWNT